MIDLHCHCLPNLDDGARDKAEALSLVKMSLDQGVEKIVFTPHIHVGRYDNTQSSIAQSYAEFKDYLLSNQISIPTAYAAEVRIDADILAMLKRNQIPLLGTNNNKQVILLELPYSHIPPGTDKLAKWLLDNNIQPLIAHPERNREIQKQPSLLRVLKNIGCLAQGTASSITGLLGESPQQTINVLLQDDLIDVVASDCHSITRRPPEMAKAYNIVSDKFGFETATQLFKTTPAKLTLGMFN